MGRDGGSLAPLGELEEQLREQVRVLVQSGKIDDPLPHLEAWLLCRRLQGDSQTRLLPDSGGVLDQNYEITWAFGIIDDQYETELELKKNFEQKAQDLEALRQQLLQARNS